MHWSSSLNHEPIDVPTILGDRELEAPAAVSEQPRQRVSVTYRDITFEERGEDGPELLIVVFAVPFADVSGDPRRGQRRPLEKQPTEADDETA